MARKYKTKRVTIDGHKFHSKGEAARYLQLKELKRRRKIKGLKKQIRYKFECGVCYIADFSYQEKQEGSWVDVVEDYKGHQTYAFKIKQKMLKHEYGIDLRLTRISPKKVNEILEKEGVI